MAVNYNPKVVTDGLVMHLDAANTKSYPGSGTTWFDLSGNVNNATLVGSPTFSSGSLTWNGTNSYATTALIPNKDSGTFCAWINMSVLKNYNTIIDNNFGEDDWEWWVYSSGRPRFRTTNGYTDIDLYPTKILSINTVYFMCVSYTVSSAKMYINGVEEASDTSVATRTTPLTLNIAGKNNTSFNGKIYSVSVYNKSLTSSEVQQNFNAIRGRYGI